MRVRNKKTIHDFKDIESVYISGPMSGVPNYNFPAFDAAAQLLREWGYEAVSPAEKDLAAGIQPDPEGKPLDSKVYAKLLSDDLEIIRNRVDALLLLPGWEHSYGANRELACAWDNGLEVFLYPDGRRFDPRGTA